MCKGGESSELEISSSELEAAYKEHSALEPLWSDTPHVTEHRIDTRVWKIHSKEFEQSYYVVGLDCMTK